jgi:hypothetical protein
VSEALSTLDFKGKAMSYSGRDGAVILSMSREGEYGD